MPINQSQLAGIVLLFSLVYLVGLRALGFRFARDEREAVIHFWRYVGTILGVDARLLPAGEADAWQLLSLHAATEFDPDEDSRSLAAALTDALPIVHGLAGGDGASRTAAAAVVRCHAVVSRLVLGRRAADALGIGASRGLSVAVVALAATNFLLEHRPRVPVGLNAE